MTIKLSKRNFKRINEDMGAAAMGSMPTLAPGGNGWPAERPGDARNPFPITNFVAKKKRRLNESDAVESAFDILIVFKNAKKLQEYIEVNPDWEPIEITVSGARLESMGKR